MPKQLHWRFILESFLDALVRQRLDPTGQLSLRNAWLHTQHLHHDVPGLADWRRRFIHSQIVKPVESPSFHEETPLRSKSPCQAAMHSPLAKGGSAKGAQGLSSETARPLDRERFLMGVLRVWLSHI